MEELISEDLTVSIRKFESFESKHSGNGEPPNGVMKVSIGKFESFESKDSVLEQPISEDPQVSTRKFESFESKDSGDGKSPDRVLKVSKDSKCKGQHVKVPKFRVERFRIGELPNLFFPKI